jgi:hypothetical protein
VEVVSNRDLVRWERASSAERLDEDRYLGIVSRLPTRARPGDWCTLVLIDSLGEARWTLVAVEPGREESIFQQQRSDARRRRRAATVSGGRAPLGGALGRMPQSGTSAPPSGQGLTAQARRPLVGGKGGDDRPATGLFPGSS